jgi:hypothetical protein
VEAGVHVTNSNPRCPILICPTQGHVQVKFRSWICFRLTAFATHLSMRSAQHKLASCCVLLAMHAPNVYTCTLYSFYRIQPKQLFPCIIAAKRQTGFADAICSSTVLRCSAVLLLLILQTAGPALASAACRVQLV